MNPMTIITAVLTLMLSSAAQASTGNIVVKIENLRNLNQGELTVALYQKVERVELDLAKAFKVKTVAVSQASLTVTFEALSHGDYAVAILHDMNKDKKMDTNWLGIPREDLAISNNTKGGPFGGPKWEDAKVSLTGAELIITPLTMNHMYDG